MYAVIKAGGKQHRVKPGDVIEVELMHSKGESVEFHPLLVVDDDNKTHVGKELSKALVTGKLVGEQKGEKIKVFKYRNKTGYARHQGHRQMYTLVEIGEIKLPGAPAAKKADSAEKPAAESDEAPAKAPAKKSSTKSTATKTAAAKTSAAAEPAAADEEDSAAPADAAPAETPPAEVAEVAAEAETGADDAAAEDADAGSDSDSADDSDGK